MNNLAILLTLLVNLTMPNLFYEIDWEGLIYPLESGGVCSLQGCVPDKNNSSSGITFGYGIDIGQLSRIDLYKSGLPIESVQKLSKYVGLKGKEAYNVLDKFNSEVILTETDVDILQHYVQNKLVNRLAQNFDKHTKGETFNNLTKEQRSVITSVAYQYGPNFGVPNQRGEVKAPKFWTYITENDWESTIEELRHFNDRYPTRRNKEADYLEIAML